ncbi:adenine deaminase [Rhodocytophaga rosea]|uniref:Adenine deaminase n=1 Tax=Rhodocytophaga rosea TaxID=2704465 RepID=A0A6C0GQD3_9BACT|nr:adenine deaminase [Rhodocytophaga rosea]QHT70285.1 adenine deaminase [Rhodocytophaga rosea]
MTDRKHISGNIVDILNKKIYSGIIHLKGAYIESIVADPTATGPFLLPGFIDAHVHIESSMLTPSQFARLAVVHGTVSTVSDPHEIGNVMGVAGVQYMVDNGKQVPFKFNFGAPSCVPATTFETAGATITAADIENLLQQDHIKYVAEMMNWPGVLAKDPAVMEKLTLAQKYNKPVDGHAPGLMGEQAIQYIQAGMSTDHECFTREEALGKLQAGMKILIREGSAAKNFEAIISLLPDYASQIMFCSDDKHPDSLVAGHINQLASRAVAKGFNVFDVLQAACINPILHYKLDVGYLQPGQPADFIAVEDLSDFRVLQTYINGTLVAEQGSTLIPFTESQIVNRFNTSFKKPEDFKVAAHGNKLQVIEAIDGQLITNKLEVHTKVTDGQILPDIENDILKITVVNRYAEAKPAIAFIKNFGLKTGAIASSVAHDSHNIIAVGCDDASICQAVNLLIEAKGGISAVMTQNKMILPLPIAGIMSGEDGYTVASQYEQLDGMAKKMGSQLQSPFMTLSFMALLVIPSLKLSDLGLFDGSTFKFTPVSS